MFKESRRVMESPKVNHNLSTAPKFYISTVVKDIDINNDENLMSERDIENKKIDVESLKKELEVEMMGKIIKLLQKKNTI